MSERTPLPPIDLQLAPCTITDARAFVAQHHRHSSAPVSGLFAVCVRDHERVRGVAIVGRPVARGLQDGWTAEVTRCCTDGARNGCSMLYGAARRAAKALGYRRLVTYTLASEKGASLRASGWEIERQVRGREWDTPSRRRTHIEKTLFGDVVRTPNSNKVRWSVKL